MNDKEVLQVKVGRRKNATTCMRRYADLNGMNVVLVQEPYQRASEWEEKWV